jgi:sugar phosphate isomerase/epimerase
VAEAVEGCVRHGIASIALWRHKIQEAGLASCVRRVKDAQIHVSSVCRGGMFPAATERERKRNLEDNYRAVDEAAALNADSLVMVVGGCAAVGLEEARQMVADGIAALVPYARQHGVRIGLEPLHPMYAAERSVLVTIGQALALASAYPAKDVGVILDTFHIWWDPQIAELMAQAAGRIYGFHVSDWLVPLPDLLMGRGLMGDGVIDNRRLRLLVEKAGYTGPIEVEIFNRALWDSDPDSVLTRVIDRFERFV